jgi:protein required for attachment to host cells
MTGEKSPHDEAAKVFAHKICEYLHKRHLEGKFTSLEMVAEPRMHGWVKECMGKDLLVLSHWTSKDLGKLSDHEVKILFLGKEAVWPHARSSQSNS